MQSKFLIIAFLFQFAFVAKSQDTFSMLAFDSLTHEIGAAGASCVDLFLYPGYSNDFICELFPDTGAIASQAAYIAANQANARKRIRAGDTPQQILTWLNINDVGGITASQTRQYGAISFIYSTMLTAAFTGTGCMNYKNHIVGRNYTIHGNILLGQLVLDSMESGFKRAQGDLACKLMAAMQGAKMIGADTRCSPMGTSSLFAFLKVTQPTDTFGKPSFLISLKTRGHAYIEPIDSLQSLFDAKHSCTVSTVGVSTNKLEEGNFFIFPNPSLEKVTISTNNSKDNLICIVVDMNGRIIASFNFRSKYELNLAAFKKGIYFVELIDGNLKRVKKLVVY